MKTILALAAMLPLASGFGTMTVDCDADDSPYSPEYTEFVCGETASEWIATSYTDASCGTACAGSSWDLETVGYGDAISSCLVMGQTESYQGEIVNGSCMRYRYDSSDCSGEPSETMDLSICHIDGDEDDDDGDLVPEGLVVLDQALDKDTECTYDMFAACDAYETLYFGDNCEEGCGACSMYYPWSEARISWPDGEFFEQHFTCYETDGSYRMNFFCDGLTAKYHLYPSEDTTCEKAPVYEAGLTMDHCNADYDDSACESDERKLTTLTAAARFETVLKKKMATEIKLADKHVNKPWKPMGL